MNSMSQYEIPNAHICDVLVMFISFTIFSFVSSSFASHIISHQETTTGSLNGQVTVDKPNYAGVFYE